MLKKRYDWLVSVINKNGYKVGAEIGAAIGNTTKRILDNCPDIELLYIADDWRPIPAMWKEGGKGMEEVFKRKIGNDSRIKILKGLSWDMAQYVKEELDFIFIDASHDKESVIKDLKAWTSLVRPGGLVSGHDTHFPGVIEALKELKIPYKEVGIDHCWAWMK